MMFHNNVSKKFLGDDVVSAYYLINRIQTKILNDDSPLEVLNKIKLLINHLNVFACVCFVLIPEEQKNKFDAKSVYWIFNSTKRINICIRNHESYGVYIDVIFVETERFYDEKNWDNFKDPSHPPSDRTINTIIMLKSLGIS